MFIIVKIFVSLPLTVSFPIATYYISSFSNVGHVALRGESSSGLFNKCLFQASHAYNAGHIWIGYGASIVVKDSTLEGGSCVAHGPSTVQSSMPDGTFGGTSLFQRTLFQSNGIGFHQTQADFGYNGGGFWINKGDATFEDSIFKNNENNNGGAIGVWAESEAIHVTVQRTLFHGNIAKSTSGQGGAIELKIQPQVTTMTGGKILNISSSTFRGNSAVYGGGAVSVSRGSLLLNNVEFVDNVAGLGGGGAVHLFSSDSDTERADQKIINCKFIGNNATGSGGGAVYSKQSGFLTSIVNSSFTNNRVETSPSAKGGALCFLSSTGQTIISNTLVNNNNVGQGSGGGAYFYNLFNVELVDSTFTSNTAGTDAGGIHATGAIPTFSVRSTDLLANTVHTYSLSVPGWQTRMYSAAQFTKSCKTPTLQWLKKNNPAKIGSAARIQHLTSKLYNHPDNVNTALGCTYMYNLGNQGMENACMNDESITCTVRRSPSSTDWWAEPKSSGGGLMTQKCDPTYYCCEECCFDFDFDGDGDARTDPGETSSTCTPPFHSDCVTSWDKTTSFSAVEFVSYFYSEVTGNYTFQINTNKAAALSIDGVDVLLFEPCIGNGARASKSIYLLEGKTYGLSLRVGAGRSNGVWESADDGFIALLMSKPLVSDTDGRNNGMKPLTEADVYFLPESEGGCEDVSNGDRTIGRGGGLFVDGPGVPLQWNGGRLLGNKVIQGRGGGGLALNNVRNVRFGTGLLPVSITYNSVTENSRASDVTGMGGGILAENSVDVVVGPASSVVSANYITTSGEHGAGMHLIQTMMYINNPAELTHNTGGLANIVATGIPYASPSCPPGSYFYIGVNDPWGSIVGDRSASQICQPPISQELQAFCNDERANIICTPSPTGTYVAGTGKSTPLDCLEGTYNDEIGQISCKPCPINFYADLVQQVSCKQCALGLVAKGGASACSQCSEGQYRGVSDLACFKCAQSLYADEEGLSSCKNCALGEYSPIGAPFCSQCGVGKYRTLGDDDCVLCAIGSASEVPGRATPCPVCGTGRAVTTGLTQCSDCLAGKFENGIHECEACGAGKYSVSSNVQLCTDCEAGYYISGTGKTACMPCLPGKYGRTDFTGCDFCAIGSASPEPGRATPCPVCEAGRATLLTGLTKCKDCLAGTFLNSASECQGCGAGKYSNDSNAQICTDCDTGQYQSNFQTTSCLPCIPGTYTDELGTLECKHCPINFFSNISKQTSCKQCELGKTSYEKSSGCQSCNGGEAGALCAKCLPGEFRAGSDQDSSTCDLCDAGKYQPNKGQASCLPCVPGMYQSEQGQASCLQCNINTFANETLQRSCHLCSTGQFADKKGSATCRLCIGGTAGASCEKCFAGKFRSGSDAQAVICHHCRPGYFQDTSGQAQCLPCLPGLFAKNEGHENCTKCPAGYLQPNSHASDCNEVESGQIVVQGGSSAVVVPLGSFIKADGSGFQACGAGTIGNTLTKMSCDACDPGMTSFNGSVTCLPCAKGKYSLTGGTNCKNCPSSFFQPQEREPSPRCKACPSGWSNLKVGEGNCISLNWKNPEDCEFTTEYLNDTSVDPQDWNCVRCPRGGACGRKSVVSQGVIPLFGWASCNLQINGEKKTRDNTFDSCTFGAACLGGSNPALFGKYKEDNTSVVELNNGNIDPATWCKDYDFNSNASLLDHHNQIICRVGCNKAYTPNSRMCGTCADSYSRVGLTGKCDRCPLSMTWNIVGAVAGGLIGVIGMIGVVAVTLSDAGDVSGGDGVQLILMSLLQMLSVFATFPIAWPSIFTSIFQVGGAIVVLGQHWVNVKCMLIGVSDVEVFYMTGIFWGLLPFILFLCCALIWFLISLCSKNKKWVSRVRVSVVSLLYLIHPTLCQQTFTLLACRSACNTGKEYLRTSLDEVCWTGRHLEYVYYLACPMFILYVVGLPIGALYSCYRVKRKAQIKQDLLPNKRRASLQQLEREDHTHGAYGALYSMYKSDYFWWEGTIVLRKILISLVAVFGSALGLLQVHLGLMILGIVILMTAVVRPYSVDSDSIDPDLLQHLELCSLATTWLTLWAGSVFNTYPNCAVSGGVILEHEGYRVSSLANDDSTETLLWCDIMSVSIGVIDVIVVIFLIAILLREKGLLQFIGKSFGSCCAVGVCSLASSCCGLSTNCMDESIRIKPCWFCCCDGARRGGGRRETNWGENEEKDADDEGKKETLQLHQDNVFPEQVMWSPNTKKQVTLEMGTMVGKRTPPSTPVRLMKKYETEAAIALPSPEKKGNKKKVLSLSPGDGNLNFDNLMWGEKERTIPSTSTALGKGIVLSTRKDGTEVIKLEWGGLLYRLCRS